VSSNLIIASLKGTYWNLGMILATITAFLLSQALHPVTQIPGNVYSEMKEMPEDEFTPTERKSL